MARLAVSDKVCILVVSHNFKELTDKLCHDIKFFTERTPYDLHVIETGSEWGKCSEFMTLRTTEKVRMTRGWNILKAYADRLARVAGYRYPAYQLFVNDARWYGESDLISNLKARMLETSDMGQIHPYQTHIRDAGALLRQVHQGGVRKVSFSEIVCPMIRGEAWDDCPDLLDDGFFYGWGLDYDMPYQLHRAGYYCGVSDDVGITHHAGTTYHHAAVTQETLRYDQFQARARANMYEVMERKYGHAWPTVLLDSVPPDVDPQALYDWLVNSESAYVETIRAWRRHV